MFGHEGEQAVAVDRVAGMPGDLAIRPHPLRLRQSLPAPPALGGRIGVGGGSNRTGTLLVAARVVASIIGRHGGTHSNNTRH